MIKGPWLFASFFFLEFSRQGIAGREFKTQKGGPWRDRCAQAPLISSTSVRRYRRRTLRESPFTSVLKKKRPEVESARRASLEFLFDVLDMAGCLHTSP